MPRKWSRKWNMLWVVVLLTFLVPELYAVLEPSDATPPLTQIILQYIPEEVFYAVFGGLALWVYHHFRSRYDKKNKGG